MDKEKKSNIPFTILIILITFIIIPFGIITLVYFNNETFRNTTNNFLKDTPGFVGEYFSKYPTEKEREEKKIYLANYYISLDNERAADKLYIIKKSDESLYSDIVKTMNTISQSKTQEIIKLIRNIELRKDLVFSIYEEIQLEKEKMFEEEINRLEKMDLVLAVEEIRSTIENNSDLLHTVEILSNMDEVKASQILYYINQEERDRVLTRMKESKRKSIEHLLRRQQLRDDAMKNVAREYEVKDAQKAYEELGNKEKYSTNDLAKIYLNLSIKKAAEILVYSQDDQFKDELFSSIREEERLRNTLDESSTVKIQKTVELLREYEEKIGGLAAVYEKMNPEEVAQIVEKMIINESNVTLFEITRNSQYEITDSKIILDVLKKLKRATLSEVLSNLDARKAAQITRRLALP